MSKFLIAKNPPDNLQENEFVIGSPDFYEQINQCRAKKPKSSQITANYLREVIAAIGHKYIGVDFDTLLTINVSRFVGMPCNSDKDVHNVLIQAFEKQFPEMLLSYVQHCFKQRPAGTNFIYFTGNPRFCTKLVEFGWEQISEKEFKHLRSGKPKKIVGKPAITAESAALLNTDGV